MCQPNRDCQTATVKEIKKNKIKKCFLPKTVNNLFHSLIIWA